MHTTRSYFMLLCLMFPLAVCAQTRQKVQIEHVTVFLNGAELYSTAKCYLPQGESEVLFTNVAGNVNQQSLTLGADNQVVVQSAVFQNNYLQEEIASPVVQALQDSLELAGVQLAGLNNKLTVIREQLAILAENRKLTGQNAGLSVTELQKMLDLISAKMTALLTDKYEVEKSQAKLSVRVSRIQNQMEEERKKGYQPGGQLLVKFYAPKAVTAGIKMSYVVPNAGWTPAYDLRVENLTDPVKLFYKANVYQNSGVKWDNVRLTLSTGNPNEGAEAPVLQPWYLSFYQPYAAPGYLNTANIEVMAAAAPPAYQHQDAVEMNMKAATPAATMAIAGGVQTDNAQAATMNSYVSTDNSGVNTSFEIDLPYSIPSDGRQQVVAVKTYDLPATYRYYAVPKLDKDVFLQARITDWEDLSLLPAQTSIFYEGSYVGQGFIDMRNVKDTMTLSLGRDKKIIVRRELDKKYRSVKTIGGNVRESLGYTISLRNTRKEPIDLVLMEQLPVSNDKDIEIEDQEADGASIEKSTGAVKWTMKLTPDAAKDLKLAYTIRYPKGKTVANLR